MLSNSSSLRFGQLTYQFVLDYLPLGCPVRWEVSAGIPQDSSPDKFQLQACLIPADQASSFTADSVSVAVVSARVPTGRSCSWPSCPPTESVSSPHIVEEHWQGRHRHAAAADQICGRRGRRRGRREHAGAVGRRRCGGHRVRADARREHRRRDDGALRQHGRRNAGSRRRRAAAVSGQRHREQGSGHCDVARGGRPHGRRGRLACGGTSSHLVRQLTSEGGRTNTESVDGADGVSYTGSKRSGTKRPRCRRCGNASHSSNLKY